MTGLPEFEISAQANRELLLAKVLDCSFDLMNEWVHTVPDEEFDSIQASPAGSLMAELMTWLKSGVEGGGQTAAQLYMQALAASADQTLVELLALLERKF